MYIIWYNRQYCFYRICLCIVWVVIRELIWQKKISSESGESSGFDFSRFSYQRGLYLMAQCNCLITPNAPAFLQLKDHISIIQPSRPPCWWFWAQIMTSNWKQWWPTMPSSPYAKHWTQMVYLHNCARHVKTQQMKFIWGLSESTLTSQKILPSSDLIWWSLNADKSTASSHTPTISQHLLCCFPASLESFY